MTCVLSRARWCDWPCLRVTNIIATVFSLSFRSGHNLCKGMNQPAIFDAALVNTVFTSDVRLTAGLDHLGSWYSSSKSEDGC